MSFTLAIVGRPNVGKSTLFNRLTGKKLALVDDRPGVTRDRREGEARLGELRFTVIDTAGLEDAKTGTLEARMRQQTEIAITQADMVLMLVDARTGLLPEDRYFADLIRKSPHEVVLAANKYEGDKAEAGFLEAYELGFGEPIGLSAEHGHGIGELYDRVKAAMGSIRPAGAASNVSETGVEVSMPLGAMTVTVNSTTVDSTNNWGASVSTTVSGMAISVGTDSEEENTFKLTGPMGPVALHLEYDSDDSALTLANDATVEAGVTYTVPGTKGTTISASYSNDDDDFDAGTQVKMAFSF